jgi:membrane protein
MSEHTQLGYLSNLISLVLSLILSFILLITVAAIIVFEVFIQKIKIQDYLSDSIPLIEWGRYVFVILMILITTSFLYKYGTKETSKISFISYGAVFTTILIILSSYIFGIYVEKFASYNELYGSIGTLLVLMFYIWINCMVLLLGFDLNAAINKLKRKNLYI